MYIKQLVLCSLMTLRKAVVLLENRSIQFNALHLVPVRRELLIFTQKLPCFVNSMPLEFNLQTKKQLFVHEWPLDKPWYTQQYWTNLWMLCYLCPLGVNCLFWPRIDIFLPFCNCMDFRFIKRFYWFPQERRIYTLCQTHKIHNRVVYFVHTPSEVGYNRGI